jgi:hypothetical protein
MKFKKDLHKLIFISSYFSKFLNLKYNSIIKEVVFESKIVWYANSFKLFDKSNSILDAIILIYSSW